MLSVSCTRLSKTSDAQLNHSFPQNSNSGDGIFKSFTIKSLTLQQQHHLFKQHVHQ